MRQRHDNLKGPWGFNFQMLPGLLALAMLVLLIGAAADKTQAAVGIDNVNLISATPAETYAMKVSALVHAQNLTALAKLSPPAPTTSDVALINRWRKQYVATMTKARAENKKLYYKWMTIGQKDYRAKNLIPAFEYMLTAYGFSTHKNTFKKQHWVQALTADIAVKAAQYDRQHRWLESLQLYNQLNGMYRISRKYHRDLQRVVRRTMLLATYVPRKFFAMQRQLAKDHAFKKPSTAPKAKIKNEQQNQTPIYSHWKHTVKGIHQDMLVEALELTEHDWVLPITYNTLLTGGLDTVQLMLNTPMLADTFPGLKNTARRVRFAASIDRLLKRTTSSRRLDTLGMIRLWSSLVTADENTVKIPRPVLIKEFIDGCMEKTDKFTMPFWPSEVQSFNKEMEGQFGGVGIEIRMDNGLLQVISPLDGTPAYRAGIQAGDVIVTVNGQNMLGLGLNTVVRKIMGPPGTKVVLGIRRGTNPKLLIFHLKRAIIHVRSIKGFARNPATGKWKFMIAPHAGIAYIRVTQFQADTAWQLNKVLKRLLREHLHGVIIDLRYNPGGYLDTAVRMCDMFLNQGTILSTRGRTAPPEAWSAQGSPLVPPNVPVILIVNQDSASASEIFSGAMRDHHRALLVGHRTYGKGCVQNVIPIGEHHTAEFKLTEQYYYLPDGECIQRLPYARVWGVKPNVTVWFSPLQLQELQATWLNEDLLPTPGKAGKKPSPFAFKVPPQREFDTQLDTALLLMRLQLLRYYH
ncbi:MAG: S41 family peptidase [Planctomycetia bacterium]|nr:S41 family peptidase [Planctomycetia bacterium]